MRKTSLIVGNGNLVLLSSRFFKGRNIQNTIGINIEANIDLGLTTGHGWNSIKVEFSKQVVILGHGTFSLKDLDQHTRLVIGVGGESLGLLGGNGSVTLDKSGHDTSSSLQTEGKWSDIQKKKLGKLLRLVSTRQNSSLDGSTISNSFIGVDGLARLLSIEKFSEQRLDLWDTSGTSNEHDLVDLVLGNLSISQNLFAGFHALLEVVHTQVLETGTGDGRVEVNTIEQGVNFNVSLSRRRKSTLGTFASSTKTTERTLVFRHILAVTTLEVLQEVVNHSVIKIFSTQVSISSSGLDFENTFFDGQQGNIKGTSTKIENQNVLFFSLLIKTVSNSSGSRFVDDTKDI